MARRVRLFALSLFGTVLTVVAFLWGNHLLGLTTGVLYAAVAAGVMWLAAAPWVRPAAASRLRTAVIIVLTVPLGVVMADPAAVDPDIQHFIDKQASDRAARRELAAVFSSDPAFAGLSVSTTQLKVVNVTVQGSLPSHQDFYRLRTRIAAECPTLGRCVLHWDVRLRASGEDLDGLDRDLFGDGR